MLKFIQINRRLGNNYGKRYFGENQARFYASQ